MSIDETPDDSLTEKIKILATDDEKIKSFGELFTNDSSRAILQLLFNEELSANQISQKTGVSLQLVKYHLNKLQDLGVVKITKIEKNSKSQDMKIYTATKFSIVIVPPKLSEKTKESKLLVRSFRHIYKVAGLAVATGISGLFSLSTLQQDRRITTPTNQESFSLEESAKSFQQAKIPSDESQGMMASAPVAESRDFAESASDVMINEAVEQNMAVDPVLIISIIATIILGGLTVFYLWKYFKK